MKVFITGIAGFIGSTLADTLILNGHTVTGCDDLSLGKAESVNHSINWEQKNCRDLTNIDADVVVHLAAQSCARWPDDDFIWENNVVTTALLKQVWDGPMVFASTNVAAHPSYGAYAGSKWACEQILPNATKLRLANVYGPRQRDWGSEPGVLASWQKAEKAGDPIRIDGDGSQTRDFIHVFDVARAFQMACESGGADGSTVDICTGVQTSVKDLADLLFPKSPRVYAERNPVDPDSTPQDPYAADLLLGFDANPTINP
jgi:UDP-glucose 4-epimerase